MNKVLVTLVLALSMAAVAQSNTQPQQPGAAGSQKVIKDPAEFNEYMTAFNTQEPAQRAKLMEAFVAKYTQSVVKGEALDFAMAGYQQAGDATSAERIATQIVAANPDHYRALLIIAYAKRARAAVQKDPQQALALATEARTAAEHALQVLPNAPLPEGVSKEDFDKQRAQIAPILNGIVAFGWLQSKDLPKAREYYLKSDLTDISNAYQLALSELEMNPIDINGFWHVVKAASLAEAQNNTAGAQQITAYGKAKYKKYHGTTDGWDAFVTATKAQTSLPSPADMEKAIPRAPSPCEIAVQVVKDAETAGTLKDLAFPDKEAVLQLRDCSPANKEAAEKVWNTITHDMQKDGTVKVKLTGVKVIAATEDTVDVALTEDNQKDNKADIHVVLEKPAAKPAAKSAKKPPVKLPAVGSMTDVTGIFTSYTPDPFMFTMEKGELPAPAKPKPPVRKPAAGKKAPAKKKK
jgi:hypothetical protein